MKEPRCGVVWLQRSVLGLVLAAFGASYAWASEVRVLTVEGTGVVFAVPDVARVRVGVTTQASGAAGALQENSESAAAIVAALRDLGVASEDVQTDNVSLFPEFERLERQGGRPPKIVGYRAVNSVSVTVRDLNALGRLLDTLVQAGATDVGTLEFQSTNIEELKDDALALAMERAEAKARRLGTAAGVTLGKLTTVTEQLSGGVGPVFSARAVSEAAVPISLGQQRVEATVRATYELEDD